MAELLPAQASPSPSPANPNPFPYPGSPYLGQSALGRNFSSPLHHAPSPAAFTAAGALSPAAAEVEKFSLSLRHPLFTAISPPTQFAGGSAGQARHSEEVRKLKREVAELAMKMRQLSLETDESRHKKIIEMNWIRRNGNMVEISFQCSCGRTQKLVAKIE